MKIDVQITRLAHGRDLPLPEYESAFAAGMDLRAAVGADLILIPGARTLVQVNSLRAERSMPSEMCGR